MGAEAAGVAAAMPGVGAAPGVAADCHEVESLPPPPQDPPPHSLLVVPQPLVPPDVYGLGVRELAFQAGVRPPSPDVYGFGVREAAFHAGVLPPSIA